MLARLANAFDFRVRMRLLRRSNRSSLLAKLNASGSSDSMRLLRSDSSFRLVSSLTAATGTVAILFWSRYSSTSRRLPSKMLSSSAMIRLPDRSSTLSDWSACSTSVEKIGFKLSPSRLLASRSSVRYSATLPNRALVPIERSALLEKSSFRTGAFRMERSYWRESAMGMGIT